MKIIISQILLFLVFFQNLIYGQIANSNSQNNYFENADLLKNPFILDSLAEIDYKNTDTSIQNIFFYRTLCDFSNFDNKLKWTWRFYNYVIENKQENYLVIGEINSRLGYCYLNIEDKKRAKEFFDKALNFYTENEVSYNEKIDFLLSIANSGLYNVQKLLKQAKEIAFKNSDYYLTCKIVCGETRLLINEEKYKEAEQKINEIENYLSNLDYFFNLYFKTQLNIVHAIILQKQNKEILSQKDFLNKNREVLKLIRENNPIEYSAFLNAYLNIFGNVDPICKIIYNDAKLFFENNFEVNSYANLYFGLHLTEYLIGLNELDEAIKLCKVNLEFSRLESFYYLVDEYDLLLKNIYQLNGSQLEYARISNQAKVTETESGLITAEFQTKNILQLIKLKFSPENDKIDYLVFLLSQCKRWRGTKYDLSCIRGAKRDAVFLMGTKNSFYSEILTELAFYYLSKYKFKKALTVFKKSYKIDSKNSLPDTEEMINSKEILASILIFNHKYEKLDTLFQSIAKYKISNLNKSFFTFNPIELVNQKKNTEDFYMYYLNYSFFSKTIKSDIHLLKNLWCTLNGISNSKSKWLFKEINENKTFEIEANAIKELQKQLNFSNSVEYGANQRNKILNDSLNKIQDQVELKLIQNKINNSILSAKKNDINFDFFIDFSRSTKLNLDNSEWTDSTQYLVFISDSKDTLVDYVFIEDGNKIDQELFNQYKKEATNFDNKTELKDTSFYNSFWKPIADKIGDAKTIYVSLGGVYNNINLNTLYNPETGKYLIEEKDIRIVNSARDFVLNKEQEKKIYTTNTAALFGFPDFNGNTTVAVDSTDFLASTRDLNSFWLDSLTRGGLKADPLPATKIEVQNISLTLKSKGWQVNSYLAENASETNIKKQESPRILHIATHGYFFPDIPIDKDNTRFLGMDRQQVVQDPMLRSGLLFTGANRTLKGEESKGENGLLSAAEASLLDLRETELVVLSACETGKGEVKNSEGVYGLRKAFSDAGAKNIIMSLWKVDDKVTQEFMSRFYEIWLNEKTTIREAFNKTQLEIKAKYPQPYYWGAFILVGE